MADDPHSNLADGWEAVESEDGRGTYWWNVNSNETTCVCTCVQSGSLSCEKITFTLPRSLRARGRA